MKMLFGKQELAVVSGYQVLGFVFAGLVILLNAAPYELPQEMHQGILTVSDYVYRNDLTAAENEAKKIIRKFPDHPVGYFCMAFVADGWMARYQSSDKENLFYRYCDLAIQKGEKLLATNTDIGWAKFFMGGADGYKGTYEARYERWITAFRYGWKGVSVLLDLEKTGYGIPDIYYGIGSYTYWRSALIKQLWWMPGIEDKRTIGIDQLYKVRKDGVYSKTWASIALIDILINEKRFEEALKISDEELKQYPECLIFLWGRARALAGLERNDQAVALCRQLILKTEHDEPDNHYNTTLYHLCCARILLKEKKHVQAISECNIINNITLDPMIKKRLEVQLNEARSIAKQAMHEMGSDR